MAGCHVLPGYHPSSSETQEKCGEMEVYIASNLQTVGTLFQHIMLFIEELTLLHFDHCHNAKVKLKPLSCSLVSNLHPPLFRLGKNTNVYLERRDLQIREECIIISHPM